MREMVKEFQEFILKGNAFDLAVGVIIGTAFGAIVNSMVNDIIMPPIGYLMGGINFSDYFADLTSFFNDTIQPAASLDEAKKAGHAVIAYGQFINNVINLIIVGLVIFMVVKQINRFRRKDETPARPARTAGRRQAADRNPRYPGEGRLTPKLPWGGDPAPPSPAQICRTCPYASSTALMHHLRQRRVREDGVHQLDFRRLHRFGDGVALDQLGDFGADHMRAEQFAGLGVEHGLDHAFGLAERDGLAVALIGEMADLHLMAGVFRRLFRQADRGDLRRAIGAAGNVLGVHRMDAGNAGDLLDA